MKRFFLIIFGFLFINISFAMNPADYLNKLPNNFKPECYKYYSKIDKSEVWNNKTNQKYKTYKINISNTKDLVITQAGFILPYKFYNEKNSNIIDYTVNLDLNIKYLNDFNPNTYIEINPKINKELVIKLKEKTIKNNFDFVFQYSSTNYIPEYYIKINNSWNLLKKENINNFSFSELKIIFKPKTKKEYLENIKIYELSFRKNTNIVLVKSFYNDNIEIYSDYRCKQKDFNTNFKNYDYFSIDKSTKSFDIGLNENPKFNVYSKKDIDNDWVEDSIDNCKYRYNPDQKDSNSDGIGDVCSDVDGDSIIGYYDNCPYVYNPDQKDINRNGVGDKCEFDKDKDGIFDKLDNCINTPNPEQKDSDKDGIGDACDNCKLYNPRQLDKNNNGIGDVCEEHEKYILEHDKDGDKIIDSEDNCPSISNPNQEDFDKDGIGDICDNCKNIQNTNQLDENKNGVGDICEDSDNDGIMGIEDNCINIANPDQKDSDNDGVGDFCEDDDNDNILAKFDNCPYNYNPDQKDTDKDQIGDACDKNDDRFIESNKNIFIGLLILIVLIFSFAIFKMIKKLK